jgi:hypothetical protein
VTTPSDKVVAVIRPGDVGKRCGDWQVTTSPICGRRWRGVWIESRYANAKELEALRALVELLDSNGMAAAVDSIFCDSQACLNEIKMRPGVSGRLARFRQTVEAWTRQYSTSACIQDDDYISYVFDGRHYPDDDGGTAA